VDVARGLIGRSTSKSGHTHMKIITDVSQVKALAELGSEDNYEFRAFLKEISIPENEIDEAFREAYESVRQQIDCSECANCCKAALPVFSMGEMKRMAQASGMPVEEFMDEYCCEDEYKGEYTFREKPCPMLQENRYTLGEAAPECCREYPHLHKPGRPRAMYSIIDNSFTCPIVYNVLEKVKPIIRSKDYYRMLREDML